ncbi:MAG: class I SAM-dependent methyltransferase [Candidatus Riflebacteria bacterium]|nr:class I SAM-dependent methyltransferase [Candidatus Riflebacteria bacterium]
MSHKFNLDHASRLDDPGRLALFTPEIFLPHLTLPPSPVLLDIGTGTGFYLPVLSRLAGPQGMVWAVDAQPDAVRLATRKVGEAGLSNVEVIGSEEGSLPLPDHSVDFALLAFVFHELEQPGALFTDLGRVLRPGGTVGIADWNRQDRDKGPPPAEIPDLGATRDLFRAHGFQEAWADTRGRYCNLFLLRRGPANPGR